MGFWTRLFGKQAPRVPPTKTIGVGGTALHGGTTRFGGYIVDGETSGDLLGTRKWISYATMVANTSIIAASQRYDLNLIGRPEWRAVPPEEFIDDPQAVEIAAFITSAMNDMTTPWHQIVMRAAMYKYAGFSWSEWTAKRRKDGKIGFDDIEPRPQSTIERWLVDENGEVEAVVQRDPATGEEIVLPRWKAVYCVEDSVSDSPAGLGLYRQMYPTARQRAEYARLEGIGYEIDLRGIPIGRAPLSELQAALDAGDITPDQREAAVAVIDDFVQHHIRSTKLGLVLDSQPFMGENNGGETPSNIRQWDVELMQGGPTSAAQIDSAIRRCDHELARVMQTEHLLLGEQRGSQSLSKDKSDNFRALVESQLRQLCRVFRKDMVLPLVRMNGWPEEKAPMLETDPVAFSAVEDLSGVMKDLADAGFSVPPDYEGVNVILRSAGLPPIDLEAAAEETRLRREQFAAALTANNANDEDEPEADDGEDDDIEQEDE